MTNKLPENFNWVKERSHCSLAVIFKELEHGVREDIATLQQLYPKDPASFDVSSSRNCFTVLLIANPMTSMITNSVEFLLTREGIKVEDKDKTESLTVNLTLNHEGQCKLKVGTEELDQWQFRKMILEKLFFGPR
jgi:hypothetical protein